MGANMRDAWEVSYALQSGETQRDYVATKADAEELASVVDGTVKPVRIVPLRYCYDCASNVADPCSPECLLGDEETPMRPETVYEKSARWNWPDGRPDL